MTFDLPDGRWLRMRLPTVNEHLAIIDLPDAKARGSRVERLRFFRDTLRAATLDSSWSVREGDSERPAHAGDLSVTEMSKLIQPWLAATEDEPTATAARGGRKRP